MPNTRLIYRKKRIVWHQYGENENSEGVTVMEMISSQITGIIEAIKTQNETEDVIQDQQKRLDNLKKVLKNGCLNREMRIDLQRKVYVLESNIRALHRKSFLTDAHKRMNKQ